MRQHETPLFTGLLAHASRNPLQFHIPGHKKGAGAPPEFRRFVGENALSIDLINIAPLDDLHHPHGMIKQAQEIAAEAFGADHTFFSVQGTSGAILSMIIGTVGPGDTILLPRNVHKSVQSAIILSGARPVFMTPEMDDTLGIAHGVSVETVQRHLDLYPEAKAVLIINPTYYGVAADLKAIVDLCHGRGVPVLVDEAHGVHIHFHERLPLSAMQAGAAAAATSVHKLGGSMTQTSVLNLREGLINPERIRSVFGLLTTTSTSYLLLASLDVARKQLATMGRLKLDRLLDLAAYARQRINEIPGLHCFGPERIGLHSACFDYDPTKLTITVTGLGLTGIEVERMLRDEFNIEVELSDLYNVLCLLSFGHTEEDVETLLAALRAISERHYAQRPPVDIVVKLPEMPALAMNPREAFYAPTEQVPITAAEGRVMAEFVMVYPPGIPILMPGEVVTWHNIQYILDHVAAGLPVQGPEDESIQTIKVVAGR